jgi:hypothetical protein
VCFSATADFVGAGVVGAIGVATLTQVRHRREVPFAALPVLFAAHQLVESFVWLGLEGHLPRALSDVAAYGYVLYAQGVLPVLTPLAVLLIEPSRQRRLLIAPFLLAGLAAGMYLFWIDLAHAIDYRILNHCIAYHVYGSLVSVFAVVYVIATCGAALFSGYRWIVAFGVANLVGLVVTFALLAHSFTSVWCAYAALISSMILMFFLRRRRAESRYPGQGPTASMTANAH